MIEQHISALLYRYQCVIVPNFGAFITESISAKINELSGTIAPPKKLILFNTILKNNDGLLANHIALEEQVSFDQAMLAIEQQVNQWLLELKAGHAIYLKNIGELNFNEEGKIIFEPIGSTNYLTSSFGLSPVLAKAITKENQTLKEVIEEPAITPKVVSIHSKRKRRPQWIGYAAACVLGIGTLGGVYQYQMDYQNYLEQSLAVEREVQAKVQQELQQATFYIQAPQIIEKTTEVIQQATEQKIKKSYHIVAGAFRSDAKAQILADELKTKGFEHATYLKKDGPGMRNVVYNSFATAEEAQVELQKIIEDVNKDAWIFIEN